MAAGSPLGNFWREVATAEWLANVGLPLFVTVGAIVAAAVALRVQLGHDRELQRAARRAAAAHELGARVFELVDEFRNRPPTDEWWSAPAWPGRRDLADAINRAKLVFDHRSAFGHADRAGRELTDIWSVCRQAAPRLDPPAEPAALAGGLRTTTAPAVQVLAELARTLLRWDGHLPLFAPGGGLAPVRAPRDREERRAWRQAVAEDFERHVREHEERHALLANPRVKPRRTRPSRRAGS